MATATKRKATLDDVWETINSLALAQRKVREAQEKTEAAQQKTEAAQQKTEKSLQETQEAQRQTEKSLKEGQERTEQFLKDLGKKLNKVDGDFNNKWGMFMEGLVRGDILNLLRAKGMNVIRVLPRVPFYRPDGTQEGEIDAIVVNGGEVVATEVKTTLQLQDVNRHLGRLRRFKEYFPEYQDKKIFGCVAYLDDENDAAKYSEEQGLFRIKSPSGKPGFSAMDNSQGFTPKEFG